MPYIHTVPKPFEKAVSLMAPERGLKCSDCRRELPLDRPFVRFKDQELCLTCGREAGLVVATRRPRVTTPPPQASEEPR